MSETFERKETGRIETFSDGVFAIDMLALWPHYLALETSFATILAMWVNHHRIFTFVQRSDHFFLYWNGLLLLLITFLPFPTTLLAEYLMHSSKGRGSSLCRHANRYRLDVQGSVALRCQERQASCAKHRP